MKRDKDIFNMHVRLFNKIAEFTYKAIDEEGLSEEQKSDPDLGHLVLITILRFGAKLAVKLNISKEGFIDDAVEMFAAESEVKQCNCNDKEEVEINKSTLN
jgi:hypothetical protein